jgi:hypothetical protein
MSKDWTSIRRHMTMFNLANPPNTEPKVRSLGKLNKLLIWKLSEWKAFTEYTLPNVRNE